MQTPTVDALYQHPDANSAPVDFTASLLDHRVPSSAAPPSGAVFHAAEQKQLLGAPFSPDQQRRVSTPRVGDFVRQQQTLQDYHSQAPPHYVSQATTSEIRGTLDLFTSPTTSTSPQQPGNVAYSQAPDTPFSCVLSSHEPAPSTPSFMTPALTCSSSSPGSRRVSIMDGIPPSPKDEVYFADHGAFFPGRGKAPFRSAPLMMERRASYPFPTFSGMASDLPSPGGLSSFVPAATQSRNYYQQHLHALDDVSPRGSVTSLSSTNSPIMSPSYQQHKIQPFFPPYETLANPIVPARRHYPARPWSSVSSATAQTGTAQTGTAMHDPHSPYGRLAQPLGDGLGCEWQMPHQPAESEMFQRPLFHNFTLRMPGDPLFAPGRRRSIAPDERDEDAAEAMRSRSRARDRPDLDSDEEASPHSPARGKRLRSSLSEEEENNALGLVGVPRHSMPPLRPLSPPARAPSSPGPSSAGPRPDPSSEDMGHHRDPPARDMAARGDEKPRKQKLRFVEDQYTPLWVRHAGHAKEGFCALCPDNGKWLQLKNSAYWYHKQFQHGVSSVSGHYFLPPLETRQAEGSEAIDGLCHSCGEWTAFQSQKSSGAKGPTPWYKHAHKCHSYFSPKREAEKAAKIGAARA